MYEDDDDDQKDEILKMLGGEVDDYAGSKLEDPNKKQGITIEISIKPHGERMPEEKEDDDKGDMGTDNEEHDPIAHILGMCRGGCPSK